MAARTNGFAHGVFGLRVRSAFDLPELPRLAEDGFSADVVVEHAQVPERLEGAARLDAAMQAAPADFQLDVPVGRFRVSEGRRILVDPSLGASEADLRPYLLGTVMGALCHQRALLPLHAAAVLVRGRAAAFAGPSGAGKSTLAARFHARGYDVLGDDLLAVAIAADGTPRALPGVARIRLKTHAPGSESPAADGKRSFPIASPNTAGSWPLWRLYVLTPTGAGNPDVRRLHGPEAVSAVVDQVYRPAIAAAMGRGGAVFTQCVALARRCEVFEASFTHASDSRPSLEDYLETHLA